MNKLTISDLSVAKKLIQSVMSFSPDAKFEIDQNGVRIPLKCDIPDKMRIEFKSDVMTSSIPSGICIKDIQRLYRAIDLVLSELNNPEFASMEMEISEKNDFLIYKNGSLQFKIGLVTDRALAGCIDTDEFKMFKDVYSFRVKSERIKALFRQSAIVRSNEARIFIVNVEGNEIAAKLEDEESLQSGMVSIKISDGIDSGEFIPIIVKADMFKSLVKFPFEECTIHYTDKKAVIMSAESIHGSSKIETRVMFAPKKSRLK